MIRVCLTSILFVVFLGTVSPLWAQPPIELPIGSQVTVIIGQGSDVPVGTIFQGTITGYDDSSLKLKRASGDGEDISWGHIKSINGVLLATNSQQSIISSSTQSVASPQQFSSSLPVMAQVNIERGELEELFMFRSADHNWNGGYYGETDLLFPTRSPDLKFGLGLGYTESDNAVNVLSKGTVAAYPLMAKFKIQTENPSARYYLEGGLGYAIMNHTLDSAVTSYCSSLGYSCSEQVKNSSVEMFGFGFNGNLNGGPLWFDVNVMELFLSPGVSASVTNLSTGKTATATGTVVLNSFIIGAGFIYKFL